MRDLLRSIGRRLLGGGFVLSVLLTAFGCGSSTGTVTGKVTYKDQPLKGGRLTFHGANNWMQIASIAEDGSYVLEKAPLGPVTITVETKSAKANPNAATKMKQPPPDAYIPKGSPYGNQGQADRYVEIPEKYADKDKSGLTYQIKSGKQTHDIPLE